jgi:alpha-L-fucosidase
MKTATHLLCLLLALDIVTNPLRATETNTPNASPAPAVEAIPVDQNAVKKWQDDRFGMFIHWGPVSLTEKEISWSRGKTNGTPVEIYDNLYKKFNPEKFNADEWVTAAKAAGMNYIVLTAKHCDGFCLWDSKLTDYTIMNTPFRRDVVKELAEACKKQGIRFGCYYSVPDTHNPDYPYDLTGRGHPKRGKYDVDAYNRFLMGQTAELIKNYGPLVTVWYDTDGTVTEFYSPDRGQTVINNARKLQPDILVDNRTGAPGDYSTPEQKIGGFDMKRPWESCMTISAHNHWAWGGEKDGVKPVGTVITMLAQCAGGDGNMLLNVGPRPDGVIDPAQVEAIRKVGDWLKVNGESIYGTRGGPYMPTPRYTATRNGNTIYLHILKWEGDSCKLPPLGGEITGASLLAGGKVDVSNQADGLTVTVPAADHKDPDTVIKLTLKGDAMALAPIRPAAADMPLKAGPRKK